MALYYSENTLRNEVISSLRKFFPRGKIDSNYLENLRANTIDYDLFLKYFDCAVSKEHNLYKVSISLPRDLEDRIPFWFVQTDGEIWVDPKSGPRGKSIYKENVFVVKFNLYVDEKDIHSFPETQNISVEKALIGEFIEIKHSLIEGNEEPIDIFKSFYGGHGIKTPKTQVSKYLAAILTVPY